jgi:DNA-binding transcriptional MerR regulator
MLSIGRFAELANVSPRTVRHYESIGLISAAVRGDNGYRYYDQSLVERVCRIRELQGLGFSLDEIKDILTVSDQEFIESLTRKLQEVDSELQNLDECRSRIMMILSVSKKIVSCEPINDHERNQFMKALREEIISGLQTKCGQVTSAHLGYLERDRGLLGTEGTQELVAVVKKCVEFAKEKNLLLGPGRGSAPASITLFGLGFSAIDPSQYNLIPERLTTQEPEIHIDVEYERGQEFVDFCRDVSRTLSYGQIHAFKMPLLDIIKNVHRRIGKEIDYRAIDDDSDLVLKHFRSGEIEKIFLFDMSEKALIMKYENLLPGYTGTEKMSEYLRSQQVESSRDILNIAALWRPHSQGILDRLDRYREAKMKPVSYSFLSPKLLKLLEPNYGLVIYHEDIVRIIAEYTSWSLDRCNRLRRNIVLKKPDAEIDLLELRRLAPKEVVELVLEEIPWSFCQPHVIAFAQLTKQTAVLRSLHQDLYFEEIQAWEKKYGFTWDDIGIRIAGVSLFQN